MAIDLARVAAVHAKGSLEQIGSGYLVARGMILTAAHIPIKAGLTTGDSVQVLFFGGSRWMKATIAWLGNSGHLDGALLRLDQPDEWLAQSIVRWGRFPDAAPVSAAAIGFPTSILRPGESLRHEMLVASITPPADLVTGLLTLHAQTSVPSDIDAGSPWAGMSGAALLSGPNLVGLIVIDPNGYGNDRLRAVPIASLLDAEGFTEALGTIPELFDVGTAWRLQYGVPIEQSVVISTPYRPTPPGFAWSADPYRLLRSENKLIGFYGRNTLVDELAGWALEATTPLAIKTITGGGGSGKTRLAAETCLAMTRNGWEAGFASFDIPSGDTHYLLETPTFIVVDDADLHVPQIAGIVRATIYSAVPVRLLLLARDRTGWWDSIHSESDGNAYGFDNGTMSLNGHPLTIKERTGLFHSAHKRFGELLECKPSSEVPTPHLNDATFGDPLLVQMLALFTLLDGTSSTGDQSTVSLRTKICRGALRREADRWVHMLGTGTSRSNEQELRRCVSIASLVTPYSEMPSNAMALEQSAIRFLRKVPELVDANASRLISLSQWLRTLHSGPSYWNPLRPDPLADQLLADLEILPDLAAGLFDLAHESGDDGAVNRLLVELTRAAKAAGGSAQEALNTLLGVLE